MEDNLEQLLDQIKCTDESASNVEELEGILANLLENEVKFSNELFYARYLNRVSITALHISQRYGVINKYDQASKFIDLSLEYALRHLQYCKEPIDNPGWWWINYLRATKAYFLNDLPALKRAALDGCDPNQQIVESLLNGLQLTSKRDYSKDYR